MTTSARTFRTKILRQHRAAHTPGLASDDALMSCGDVYTLSEGLVGLRGDVLRVFRYFEYQVLELARRFGAEECQYPVLLPAKVLEEVGYLGHFPQHVTWCSHFPEDLPLLEEVARVAVEQEGKISEPLLQRLEVARHALKPAVCLPCYGQYRDTVVPRDQPVVVTMQNHVFRNEPAGYQALGRLWDFHVRDVVFMGSYVQLQQLRQEVMDAAMALCETLDLTARLELANDPFFLDPSAHKAVYQRLGEVKYELLLAIPHREIDIAASSFNLHRTFYSSIYGIQREGEGLAETACMGFGLERWVYAFLSQKGMDPAGWPAAVASWVEADRRLSSTAIGADHVDFRGG
jgi:seryl-tRNA synthetase